MIGYKLIPYSDLNEYPIGEWIELDRVDFIVSIESGLTIEGEDETYEFVAFEVEDAKYPSPISTIRTERIKRLEQPPPLNQIPVAIALAARLIKDVRGANLPEADLQNANLQDVSFVGANLYNADLRDTDLRRANMKSVYLISADISILRCWS